MDVTLVHNSFLAVEALLIALTGPSLPLVPTADPSDDLLDLVAVREGDRDALRRHRDRRLAGEEAPAPPLARRRVRCVELTPPPSAVLRLDDESWESAGDVLVARTGAAVELLLL